MGVEAAALCINFIVRSLEDIDLGALPGVPGVLEGLDILGGEERPLRWRDEMPFDRGGLCYFAGVRGCLRATGLLGLEGELSARI